MKFCHMAQSEQQKTSCTIAKGTRKQGGEKVPKTNFTIVIKEGFINRDKTRITFSTNETTVAESENLHNDLKSKEFPSKLNSCLNALLIFKQWHQQMPTINCSLLTVSIQGNPMYAFFIVKHLIFSQIPFNLEVTRDTIQTGDYLENKYRQFVIEAANKDFSSSSSLRTQNYPSSFIKCHNDLCIHETKNFLDEEVKYLDISIILPTRNIPDTWLEKLISEINSQRNIHDEIILIDDNDEPKNFTNLKNQYINFKVIRGNRSGISEARNLGVSESNNDLLLFIDSDDEILPGFIDSQRQFHMKYRNVSATGVWLQAFGSHNRVYPQWDGFSPLAIFQCLPPAGVLMWKKNALTQVGNFHKEFAKGFEDFDLVARAISMDHLIVTIDEIMYKYRRGHTSLTQSLNRDDQEQLSQLVWRNARNLCETNFVDFIKIGIKYGEKLYFASLTYLFLGKKQLRYLAKFFRKLRNNKLARELLAVTPGRIRRSLFHYLMKH
jgi:glycosyltransferase involved in cell wall biosynthesis